MENDALQLGRDFVASIMADITQIPRRPGIGIMKNVPSMTTGIQGNVFIRKITEPFWEECIRVVNTQGMRVRVCAVGTPGIGKTTSTSFLIRMLLKKKVTVVYRIKPEDFFWEFQWNNEENRNVVRVYPQETRMRDIDSLTKDSTFYIVDPGTTIDSCLPPDAFKPRTIIVSSPDGSHWGGKHFPKERLGTNGRFRYYPMWDLDELLLAQPYLAKTGLTKKEVVARFRLVGGVPRHIFADDEDFQAILLFQQDAIDVLTSTQAEEIVLGKLNAVGTFESDQPKSAVIGYSKAITEEIFPFSSRQVEIVSASVEEKVSVKFMAHLWNLLLRDGKTGWKNFEAYCRALMTTPSGHSFLRRPCCGKVAQKRCRIRHILLGGCHTVRLGEDLAKDAIEGDPMILFHSVDPKHPLFDFIYKDNKGTFHAFQVTLGKTHLAPAAQIETLRSRLGTSRLAIYYVIPSDHLNNFVTIPANPTRKEDRLTSFWHILVPNPREEPRR
jgi:hypothetical protein